MGPDSEVVLALVLALLEAAPRPMTRVALCELLWEDIEPSRAGHNLRQTVYKLKRLGMSLDATSDALALPRGIAWDLEERLASALGSVDPQLAWTFLTGYEPRVSNAFSVRIERWRERVHHHLAERVLAEVRQSRARTQWSRAATWCDALLAIDPLNEEATLTLAEGKALLGSKAEAVALLDRYLAAIEAGPGELAIQPTLLRRRISERMPIWPADRSGWKVLVGRDALLESLAAHMRRAREGTGTIVSMWGEPGIGKTRLLRELNALGGVDGWSLATVSCEPSWPDRPLCALEVMVSTLLLQPGALGVDPKAHRALLQLTRIDPDDRGMPIGAEDTAYRQRLLRSSLLDLIDAVAAERPLLIAIDDAQWIDPSSLPFLSMAVEHAATRRVAFVFVAQQRDDLPKMASGARALVARVPALTSEESERLMATLVHGQPPSDRPELLRRAAAVSNGNPLYLHTLATHWLSTGDTSELPPSLEALIEQRLDTLAPPVLRCLQLCALLARHATVGRVEAVLQAERAVLLGALDDLHQAGLLETVGDAPLVRHGLIGKRAVGRASGSTVVLLHRYIAAELEPAAREGLNASLVLACAEHWRDAKEEKRGEELIEQTVRRLVRTGSMDAAWAVIKELKDAADAGDRTYYLLALRLCVSIARATGDRQVTEQHAQVLLNALSDAPENAEPRLYAETMVAWGGLRPDLLRAGAMSHHLSLMARTRGYPRLLAQVIVDGFVIADQQLSWPSIRRVTEELRTHDALQKSDDHDCLRARMMGAYYNREFTQALALAERRLPGLDQVGDTYSKLVCLQDISVVLRHSGREESAGPLFAEILALEREGPFLELRVRVLAAQLHWHLDAGRVGPAAAISDELRDATMVEAGSQSNVFAVLTLWRLALAMRAPIDEVRRLIPAHMLRGDLPRNPRQACFVAAARFSLVDGSSTEIRDAADVLIPLAIRTAGWNRSDMVVAIAARAVSQTRGADRARRFVSRALFRRFEESSPIAELASVCHDLGLADLPDNRRD